MYWKCLSCKSDTYYLETSYWSIHLIDCYFDIPECSGSGCTSQKPRTEGQRMFIMLLFFFFCITFQINYRRTSPLRAPLWKTPPHFSANIPYPSHTLLPDPTTPTPPLLSLQSECHQCGFLGSLFILPIAVSKKVSSFSHDIFLRGWDINPSSNSQPRGPGVAVWSFTQNLPSTFKPTRNQGPNWY